MKYLIVGCILMMIFNTNAQNMNQAQETVTNLFIATDAQDWQMVADSFAEKVELDYSSMSGNPAVELSPEEIVESWKGILPGFLHTHHQLGNFIVKENGSIAQVFCYGTATHYLPDENGDVWAVVGSYDFELIQNNGLWKITKMKFNFKYQTGNLSLPEKAIATLK